MKPLLSLRSNLASKLVSLILAVITYSYVQGETKESGHSSYLERRFLQELETKVVPVKVELKGEPPPGYKILRNNIRVKPEKVVIVGRRQSLDQILEIPTQEIDVRKFTHTQVLYVSLEPVRDAILVDKNLVEVEIPVVVVR